MYTNMEEPDAQKTEIPASVEFELVKDRLLEVDAIPERQLVRVERELSQFESWMLTKGKSPDRNKPLAEQTANDYIFRIQQFLIFTWANTRQITVRIDTQYADAFVEAPDDDTITKG